VLHDKCKKDKKKFSDPYFKNNNDSICKDSALLKKQFGKIKWSRMSDMKSMGKLRIFDDKIEPADIA
jgi:hypothetical protein